MKLKGSSGAEIQLVVLGYEYPDVHEDRWDSNWLTVSGHAADPQGTTWRFSAPCVTTFELADLADWLEGLAADGRHPDVFEFTEPHLRFAYTPWPRRALHVTLNRELAPSQAAGEGTGGGLTLEFPLPEVDAVELAAQVRSALVDFPVRGGAA